VDPKRAIHAVWRIESARLIAGLARWVRDVGLAEDRFDGSYISQTGRTSIEPCSAAGIFAAYPSASSMFAHSRT